MRLGRALVPLGLLLAVLGWLVWAHAAPAPDAVAELLALRQALRGAGSESRPLYVSPVIRAGQDAVRVSVDVTGAQMLVLTAIGVPNNGGVHSVWVEPEVIDAEGKRTKLTEVEPFLACIGWRQWEVMRPNQAEIGGKRMGPALWAHAHSVILFRLDGKYRRFESAVGINTPTGGFGAARFEVGTALPANSEVLRGAWRGLSEGAASLLREVPLPWDRWFTSADTDVERRYLQELVRTLGEQAGSLRGQVDALGKRNPGADSPEWLRLCREARTRQVEIEAAKALLAKVSAGLKPVFNPALEAAYGQRRASLERAVDEALRGDLPAVTAARVSLDAEEKLQAKLILARKTLDYVQRSRPLPELARELPAFEKRYATSAGTLAPAMLDEVARLRRRVIFSHPALDFEKLLICVNPPTTYSHNCDQYLGRHSRVGKGIAILTDWKTQPRVTYPLQGKLPRGAYAKPDLSFDGQRLLFAFADHTPQDASRRRFFLYEAAVDGSWVKQVTGTARDPLKGWMGRRTVLIEDNDPCYLPDGGIAFVSSRSQNFGRCHGGRYTPAFLLFRCDGDGSNIRQISWGEGNEDDPSVLDNGGVVYTRWEYVDRHEMEFHKLWWTRPDGTAVANFYGNDTIYPLMIAEARSIPGTGKVVATAMAHHSYTTGTIIAIDPRVGENGPEPVTRITPEIRYPEGEIGFNTGGSYSSPWPLNEEMYLAAFTPEDVRPQGSLPSPNGFGIYLVDTLGGRELIYRDPEMSAFCPTPVRPRPMPPAPASTLPVKPQTQTGVYVIENVALTRNDPQGILKPGEIRYLRFNELYNKPAASNAPVSAPVGVAMPKRILGTVPVDASGSVAVRVPACIPLQIQALDERGMAVMTERSFHYLQPGEVRSCVGCHESPNSTPVLGARSGYAAKAQDLTPPAGPRYEGGLSFPRTVQPVLDRYCIGCHGLGGRRDGGVSLLGTPAGAYSEAYQALVSRVRAIGYKPETHGLEKNISRPKDYYAHGSKLGQMLLAGHAGVSLDRESFARLVEWLDLNAQAYGDYSHNRVERRRPDPKGEQALRDAIRERFGEDLAKAPYHALVNVGQPDESRILRAPLTRQAGGWGQIERGAWRSTSDPSYARMYQLVEASIAPLTRQDVAGTCGSHATGGNCSCGCCWVVKAEEEYRASLARSTAAK